MENVFRTVLNMSLTGSYVILAVLIARLLLVRAPKKYALALWAVAGFRLCCPVSFESILSLFRLPVFDMTAAQADSAAVLTYFPESPAQSITTGLSAVNHYIPPAAPVPTEPLPVQMDWMVIAAWIWVIGMALMTVYSLVSYLLLHRRVCSAIRVDGNIYRSDAVRSPFILGFFRPKIYLPASLSGPETEYVLAHERMHLKKLDQFHKLLAYGILTLHWFNPLCHLAFRLMAKDMEMRCDEAVLAQNLHIRSAYSTTLVNLAVQPGGLTPSPLAFGETSVHARVKNILRWKKPRPWVSFVAVAMCLVTLVACAANPVYYESIFGQEYRCFDNVATIGAYNWSGHYMTYTGPDFKIDDNGTLYYRSNLTKEAEWLSCGKLEEFTLTEDNFDALLEPLGTGWIWNTYDELFTLRQRTVDAWKAEIPSNEIHDSDLYQNRTSFHYVFRVKGGNLFVCSGFSTDEYEQPYAQITSVYCIIPHTADSERPVLDFNRYDTGDTVYRSPNADLRYPPTVSTVLVRNDLLELWEHNGNFDSMSMYDAFYLSDRHWQDFPFSEKEWDAMTIDGNFLYPQFRDAKYLNISLQYFLLEADGTIYLCYGSHDPDSEYSNIQTIQVLVPAE